jgi:3-methyladenine DNA glycosylase AlkD
MPTKPRAPRRDALAQALLAALAEAADPAKAPQMQAYMKSAMPYLGVSAPALRRVCKAVFAPIQLSTAAAWQSAALSLWRGARFREERYAAVELTGDRRARAFQTMGTLPMYEEMIVTGAWWDYVDVLAKHRLGPLLAAHPAPMRAAMLAWSRDADLWKRRSSILCQLDFKERTDLDLLYACIEPSIGAREFFLRKAIGWALRQYAWTDAREVARYVKANEARLSPLSRREALKNAGAAGLTPPA